MEVNEPCPECGDPLALHDYWHCRNCGELVLNRYEHWSPARQQYLCKATVFEQLEAESGQ